MLSGQLKSALAVRGFQLFLIFFCGGILSAALGAIGGNRDLIELSKFFLLTFGVPLFLIGLVVVLRHDQLPSLKCVQPWFFTVVVMGVMILGLGIVPPALEESGIIEEIIRNTTITDWVGGGNIRLLVEDAHFGDFRTYGEAEFTLKRVNGDKEFWTFADEVTVYIEDSDNFTPLIHGRSRVKMVNTTFTGLQAYGDSQVELINTQAGFEIEPTGEVMSIPAENAVGNRAVVIWKDSLITGRTLVFDQAKLTLENVKLTTDAELVALGSAELVIKNAQPQHQLGGTLYIFGQSNVTIQNSRLATVIIEDLATINIISSEIGTIYRGLRINGTARIENGQLIEEEGQIVKPTVVLDEQSKVSEQLWGRIEVQPEGDFTLIKTRLIGNQSSVYAWGKVRAVESDIEHFFAYNPTVPSELKRSHAQYVYLAAYASSGKSMFEAGKITGDLGLTKLILKQSRIDQQVVGAVLISGTAHIKIRNARLDRIIIQDEAQATVSNVIVRQIIVSRRATADLYLVVYAPPFKQVLPIGPSDFFVHRIDVTDLTRLEQYPPYPWTVAQGPLSDKLELPLEVGGQAHVSANLAAEEVRVRDWAELTLKVRPFESINYLVACDQARVVLYGVPVYPDIPGIFSTILTGQAVMIALDGAPGTSHVLVMDDALLYQQTTSNQEVLMGPLNQHSSNAMIIHVSKEAPHFPGAGSSPKTIAGRFTLNGTVFVNVWPMVNFTAPVRHYAGLLNDYNWPKVEAWLDNQSLPRAQNAGDWPVFLLETDRFADGDHMLTIKAQHDGKTIERRITITIRKDTQKAG